MIIRAALDLAVERELVERNVAHAAHARRAGQRTRRRTVVDRPTSWPPSSSAARTQRLYPALHLAAHTGMRRGEIVGLKWSDLDRTASTAVDPRTVQYVGGRPVEFGVKTRTSRRSVELDHATSTSSPGGADGSDARGSRRPGRLDVLQHRRPVPQPRIDQPALRPHRRDAAGLPRIRFHDLRHTHASLLVAAGVPIKVVSERLGHAHPAFTMHTYQHLLPGMSAAAAERVRRPRRHRQPVDVYRLDRRKPQVNGSARRASR